MNTYILLAIAWVILCSSIGFYINGIGLKDKSYYKIGFVTMGVFYLIGVCLLIGAITVYK